MIMVYAEPIFQRFPAYRAAAMLSDIERVVFKSILNLKHVALAAEPALRGQAIRSGILLSEVRFGKPLFAIAALLAARFVTKLHLKTSCASEPDPQDRGPYFCDSNA